MIVIVDYGGQYVHRIWRSLRYLDAESEIVPSETPWADITAKKPDAYVLSGGPHSIHKDEVSEVYRKVIDSRKPVLGICLGHQLIAHHFGGKIMEGRVGEYAEVEIEVVDEDELFAGIPKKFMAWESHRDEVSEIPEYLKVLAKSATCPIEALKHKSRPIYGVQFHPEVEHTQEGPNILKNFLKVAVI
jgi:GMP synthase (glutamine-hydrolysing)